MKRFFNTKKTFLLLILFFLICFIFPSVWGLSAASPNSVLDYKEYFQNNDIKRKVVFDKECVPGRTVSQDVIGCESSSAQKNNLYKFLLLKKPTDTSILEQLALAISGGTRAVKRFEIKIKDYFSKQTGKTNIFQTHAQTDRIRLKEIQLSSQRNFQAKSFSSILSLETGNVISVPSGWTKKEQFINVSEIFLKIIYDINGTSVEVTIKVKNFKFPFVSPEAEEEGFSHLQQVEESSKKKVFIESQNEGAIDYEILEITQEA